MGFRYRKSINLGGGFRINISKSGVGYSWGVKGYRVTKTAKGTVRRTVSIPGTGISYTEESRTDKPRPAPSNVRTIDTNHYAAQEIANSDATQMVSSGVEELLAAAKRTISVDKNATIGIVVFFLLMFSFPPFLLGALLCIALKIYARTAGLIKLDYEIDSDQMQVVAQRMEPMVRLSESKKIWRIMQSSRVIDTKYSGGAGHTVKRIDCQTSRTLRSHSNQMLMSLCSKPVKKYCCFYPINYSFYKAGKLEHSIIVIFLHLQGQPDLSKIRLFQKTRRLLAKHGNMLINPEGQTNDLKIIDGFRFAFMES